MQANHVELPPEELIELGDFVKAIVKALYPDKTEGLTGLECIEGTRAAHVTALPPKNHNLDFGAEPDSVWKRLFVPPVECTELPHQLELPLPKVEFTQDVLRRVVEDETAENLRCHTH